MAQEQVEEEIRQEREKQEQKDAVILETKRSIILYNNIYTSSLEF